MASEEDLLIGQIAVTYRMVTEDQVRECIKIQESEEPDKPLGAILVEKEYLTPSQLDYLIRIQEEKLDEIEEEHGQRLREVLFGRIALQKGWITESQLNECLREKANIERLRIYFRLGEIMIKKGYLNAEQVEELLALQDKKILYCPDCGAWFNITAYENQRFLICSVCGGDLEIPLEKGNVTVRETLGIERMSDDDDDLLDSEEFFDELDEEEEIEGLQELVREIRELEAEIRAQLQDEV